jgi:hypothetical protein
MIARTAAIPESWPRPGGYFATTVEWWRRRGSVRPRPSELFGNVVALSKPDASTPHRHSHGLTGNDRDSGVHDEPGPADLARSLTPLPTDYSFGA